MTALIIERTSGSILVWDSDETGATLPPDGTLLFQFSIEDYPDEYQTIAASSSRSWDGSNLSLDGQVYLDAAWIAARASELETDDEEQSFVEAMRPVLKNWFTGVTNTTDSLTAIGTVLDNHTTHKAIVNGVIWQRKRLTANPLANVTLGNIIGNPNAEAAYLEAVFEYATQVKTWRGA